MEGRKLHGALARVREALRSFDEGHETPARVREASRGSNEGQGTSTRSGDFGEGFWRHCCRGCGGLVQ